MMPYGYGGGMGYGGGFAPYGMGYSGYSPMMARPGYSGMNSFGMNTGMPQTINGTDPLINAIRHTVRRPKRR
jgi:hypothetical protein